MTRPLHRRIDEGGHRDERVGACVMEWVSLLQLGYVRRTYTGIRVDWAGSREKKTDNPTCTNNLITTLAIDVNDHVAQEERDRLAPLIPRILRARRGRTREEEQTATSLLSLRIADRFLEERSENEPWRRLIREATDALLRGDSVAEAVKEYSELPIGVKDWQGRALLRELLVRLIEAESDPVLSTSIVTCSHWSPLFFESADMVQLLSDALDLHEKVQADLGLLGDDDPEINYADPETVEALVKELTR